MLISYQMTLLTLCFVLLWSSFVEAFQIAIPGIPFSINVPFSMPFTKHVNKKAQEDEKYLHIFKNPIQACNEKEFIIHYRKHGAQLSSTIKEQLTEEATVANACLEQKKSLFSVERENKKINKSIFCGTLGLIPSFISPFVKHIVYQSLYNQLSDRDLDEKQLTTRVQAGSIVLLGAISLGGIAYTIYKYGYIQKHQQKKEDPVGYYAKKKGALNDMINLLKVTRSRKK